MALSRSPWTTSGWQQWLPKSIKVALTLTSLSLLTLSCMQMHKDTTDMLWQVLCSQVIYCQSDKKLLGCCFWRTTGNHRISLWNIWSKVAESTVPSKVKPAKAKFINLEQKKMPWKSEVREWSDTISYMKRCIRTNCQVKDRDSGLNSKIKSNKKQAWHGAEREKQSSQLMWLLYMS